MQALAARVAGQFAARGEGEVCAVFKRSFYLRFAGDRYACVGNASIGRGPLNAIVDDFTAPALGERIDLSADSTWQPATLSSSLAPDLAALREAAQSRAPREGLGCLVAGSHNALSAHGQPALEALERWLAGHALEPQVEELIGLGPGLTPAGDDYLGGVLVALRSIERGAQAVTLWRWLEPRLEGRTNAISAAHLAAAAQGEAHEALHACLEKLFEKDPAWEAPLSALAAVGHGSGWNGLAGVTAVLN
jgi:hypothetical protein